jgi:RNA polymerase sigma-70 factor (ECF subfamily)
MHDEAPHDTRMDPARERDLVARARADPSAFGELYDYYLPRIHGFILRRVREASVAEDLTATTFERALGVVRRDDFRNDSFGGWLYRVAGNAVVDHVRRDRRSVPLGIRAGDGLGDDEHIGSPNGRGNHELGDEAAAGAFAAAIDRDVLSRALLLIPPEQRRVIVLRFVDGLDPAEMAVILGCSRSTVAVRVHRALRALRDVMPGESTDVA